MLEALYLNRKNERICLSITHHARKRFVQRWLAAFEGKDIPLDVDMAIIELFNNAVRVRDLSRKEKTRLRRYGKDTLFFKNKKLTFIVKDTSLITIELSCKYLRRFNKESSTVIKNHFSKKNIAPEKKYHQSNCQLLP